MGYHKMNFIENWIWHELNYTILETHKNIKQYRFDLLAHNIYEFVWNNYCDWYIEFAKTLLNSKETTKEEKQKIKFTLAFTLENILIIAHPIIPFITEKIFKD